MYTKRMYFGMNEEKNEKSHNKIPVAYKTLKKKQQIERTSCLDMCILRSV